MFHAYQTSEDDDRIEVLRTLFDQPGLHCYPFVEVPLNTQLFHLDVAPVDNESRWQRFIFDKIENIFEFAAFENIHKFRIHIQTRRESSADYQLKRVVEISMARAASGESVYAFSCADGSTEISGYSGLSQRDLERISRLWQEPRVNECEKK